VVQNQNVDLLKLNLAAIPLKVAHPAITKITLVKVSMVFAALNSSPKQQND
jgi:hypothetical protein